MGNSKYVLEKEKETEEILESWGQFLEFLQRKGMMAEFTTRFEIKPMSMERKEQVEPKERKKTLVQNILLKRSHDLSLKLRKDFSLGEIADENVDLSLLDGLLSEYADEEEDSVELIRSTRRRI